MTEVIGVARSSGDADQGRSRASKRHVPGEPGIWVLLFGDMMVFTVLFTVYLHQRGVRPALFAESQGPSTGRWARPTPWCCSPAQFSWYSRRMPCSVPNCATSPGP